MNAPYIPEDPMERGNGDGKHRDDRDYDVEPSDLSIPTLDRLAYEVHAQREETRKWQLLRDKEVLHLNDSIQGLIGMVQNSEKARAEDMRVFTRELKEHTSKVASLDTAVGDLSEQVGRLLAEVSQNHRQDSLQDDIITDVHHIATQAYQKSEQAREEAVKAARKKQLVIFGQRSAPTAVVLAIYEIGQRLGWW